VCTYSECGVLRGWALFQPVWGVRNVFELEGAYSEGTNLSGMDVDNSTMGGDFLEEGESLVSVTLQGVYNFLGTCMLQKGM